MMNILSVWRRLSLSAMQTELKRYECYYMLGLLMRSLSIYL